MTDPKRPSGKGNKPPRPKASGRAGRVGTGSSRPKAKAPRVSAGGESWKPETPPPSPPDPTPPGKRTAKDEGMLKMRPVSGADPSDTQKRKSATQFFSIPTPKKKQPPPPDMDSGSTGGPPSSGPPPVGPPVGPMGGMGSSGIQGPVASGPASQSRFGDVVSPDAQGGAEASRAKSWRVFAIVIVLFGVLCMALVAAVLLVQMGDKSSTGSEVSQVASTTKSSTSQKKSRSKKGVVEDTGAPPAPEVKRAPRRTTRSTSSKPKAAPAPPPPSKAPVTITIPAGSLYSGIEIKCSASNFRNKSNFSGGKATVANVPTKEECTLFFKGGSAAQTPIRGGQTKSCTFADTRVTCK